MEAVEATDSRNRDTAEVSPKLRECSSKALCVECFWWVENGGQCSGCYDDYQQRCLKQVCNYDCYDSSADVSGLTHTGFIKSDFVPFC